ncbi:MAG TPA: amino acid adenylation domain-containing protein [Thermoanaerobaculia bacterium]|nr:amino acid adenylation domain-containing protein [Thermoanaerobaculia bacterium]
MEAAAEELAAPRTPAEELLAGIWAQVLGLERVGVNQSFFELGGHSLLATQVMSRVKDIFGIELPLRSLFATPTVAALAAELERMSGGDGLPPLVRVERRGDLPLSFAQQRLWFLEQLQPGSPVYNMPVALRLRGELSVPALRASLSEVVRRHESLRTVFVLAEGQPFQRVLAPGAPALGVIDLGGLGHRERENELARLVREHGERPFDLAAGPLLRSSLVRLGADEHAVLLAQHHIVSDGWSTGVLVREVVALYGAFAAARPSPLPELSIQYPDFAVWQRGWLAGEVLERQVSYWRERLAGLPELLELPTDRPRPAFRTGRGARHAFHLPGGLRDLGRREGATDFMALLALFQILLSRLSGQEDLATGTVIANRGRSELEPLIGFFANTLVLRGDLSGRPSLRDVLLRTRESALEAYAHQDLPFEHLVEALQPPRSTSHTPLFQVMLVLQNAPWKTPPLPGLETTVIEGSNRTGGARFDLTLDLAETTGSLEYATDLFDAPTIARLAGQLATLLAEAVAAPSRLISELPLLGAVERQQLMLEWNDTEAVREPSLRIHELFERQTARRPHTLAVAGQGMALSYAELDAAANRLARYLRRQGVGPEARVALCVDRSPEMVVALLGILKAGAAYVPLDPAHPAERIAMVLGDSAPAVLVTEQRWLERLSGNRVVCLDRDRERIAAEESSALPSESGSESLAYVIYTSGSTGRPKGVALPHRAVVNFLYAMVERLGLGEDEVVPALTTLTFDIAGLEIYLPLALGGRVEVVAREEAADGRKLAVAAAGATLLQATPATWRLLLDSGWEGRPGLKALCGGEALPWALASELLARGVDLWNVYGPTETAVWSAAVAVEGAAGDGAMVGLGRPLANTVFHVVDRDLDPVPVGAAGELLIGGMGVARGYWGRPELTAERFVPDPWSAGARLYRTGDLVRRRAGGELEFLGRIDHQVKLRGFRIELGEIEAVLALHPEVQAAVVLLRDDLPGGRGLVAYVVAEQVRPLRGWLEERLPGYMVPAAFVAMESLPQTPSGKVDRRALARIAPEMESAEDLAEPRTPTEELLAGIWAQVLGLERVGAGQSFFELGGHSLTGAQVVSRLRQVFQVDLPLRVLFEAPTVAGMAAEIERLRRQGTPERPAISSFRQDRSAPAPLSFAQERFWTGRHVEARTVASTIPTLVAFEGRLDLECLRRAMQVIVERHEVFRTTFRDGAGGPVQVVHDAVPVRLPVVDLEGIAPARQRAEIHLRSTLDGRSHFDYERGPLFRTTVFRFSERESAVLFTIHHVAFDGWSTGVLLGELSALYNAFRESGLSPLRPLAAQYQDFARWQRQTLAGETLAKEVAFWREHLRGAVPLDLSGGRRPARPTWEAGIETFAIPGELERKLDAFAAEQGVTLFMTLLAAFKTLLHQETGSNDVVVTGLFANRNQIEIENLIGNFYNGLPLRTRLDGVHTFRDLLHRVRDVTLAAHEHPDILYEPVMEGMSFLENGDRGGLATFRILFQLAKLPPAEQELSDVKVTRLPFDTGKIRQDLSLFLTQSGQLGGRFKYNRDVLDAERVVRMRDRFLQILEAAVAAPDSPLSELLSQIYRGAISVTPEKSRAARQPGYGRLPLG